MVCESVSYRRGSLKNVVDVIKEIEQDEWMMDVLRIIKQLDLPDWWVCAGFVRSKIWDMQHGFKYRTPLSDIDVIFFERTMMDEMTEKKLEERLCEYRPNLPWSVKNQARMHEVNDVPPYISAVDGISKFPETATALGVKLSEENRVILVAPWGIDDALNLLVKPTPSFMTNEHMKEIYEKRMDKKKWNTIWHKVDVFSFSKNNG